ncbi:AoPex11B-like protein [Cordyceps javanica]|uniref:AoPex11B-like protein n=1 Tax=Cordyceps javanica TaxID=43265 RepID=A0A545UZN4_9HYPO|nr:AoPex11B-like protein [Cordyceps javanica]TQW05856.1 AoPex11B-like protein [Cordyceps javanica]
MAKTVETFIAFGADIFALERMMRLLQGIAMILTSYTGLIALAQPSSSAAHHLATRVTLVALQDWLNVTRRSLRTFWFLRAFQGSYAQYRAATGGGGGGSSVAGVEDLLDVVAGSLLGIFGLLETITLPDMMRIPGLAVFGADETRRLNVQAQMFWFLALLAAVLGSGVRVFRAFAERAVPAGDDFGAGLEEEEEKDEADAKSGGGRKGEKGPSTRKRDAERKRKQDKAEAARKTRAQISALTLKIASDTLDMVIPANVCGWSNFHPGQVGAAMAITSLITLRSHWERCGRAVQ